MPSAIDVMGRIGLPAPIAVLARQRWDAIVIGAGHNGLTCAAYLARAGRRVLVLEARERIGGACTLEEPWPGVFMSPCAYVCGLLHPLVIDELDLPAYGFHWTAASAGLFTPFDDGTYVQFYDDDARCEDEIRRLAPADLPGWRAMKDVLRRARDALRPPDGRDVWIGPAPTRTELEARLGDDPEARALLFEWSMAEYTERYLGDERLQIAYMSQGIIGTDASPFDPGTASIRFHHESGRMGNSPGTWGYVRGGMGRVSFMLCDIARAAGATVAAGVPVASIVPGEGVVLESGERIAAPIVVSNADPVTTLRLLGATADPAWRARVERIPMRSVVAKFNLLLRELPSFKARPGTFMEHHLGQIDTPLSKADWRAGHAASRRGELPRQLWTEQYFHTVHDRSVIAADSPYRDAHTMSVFAQYLPYEFAHGTWDSRREDVKALCVRSLARYIENFPDAILAMDVLGPPDIEARTGLTGGHIFHGEILPQYMWRDRLDPATPMPGIFLCGAGTHPGGSVIAINGRNAAMAILAPQHAA